MTGAAARITEARSRLEQVCREVGAGTLTVKDAAARMLPDVLAGRISKSEFAAAVAMAGLLQGGGAT